MVELDYYKIFKTTIIIGSYLFVLMFGASLFSSHTIETIEIIKTEKVPVERVEYIEVDSYEKSKNINEDVKRIADLRGEQISLYNEIIRKYNLLNTPQNYTILELQKEENIIITSHEFYK